MENTRITVESLRLPAAVHRLGWPSPTRSLYADQETILKGPKALHGFTNPSCKLKPGWKPAYSPPLLFSYLSSRSCINL